MNYVKYTLFVMVLIGLVFAMTACTTQSSPTARVIENINDTENVKVRIGNLPVVHGLPLYVAIEKGYFAEENIQVEFIKFEAPNQIIDALMNNQIDIGPTSLALGISAIADNKNPGKIKIYAVSGGTMDKPTDSIITLPQSNIKKIEDLKGKKLGILAGTIQWRTITRYVLEEHGLDMDKDVTIIELAPALQIPALASGQIDAMLALEPIPTIAVSQGIAKIAILAPAEQAIAEPFYGGAGVISTTFARDNPETARKVLNILNRAMDEINNNPDEYRKYLIGYTPLNENITAKAPLPIFKNVEDLSDEDLKSIQIFLDLFEKYGVVNDKLDFEKIMYKP